MLQSRRYSHAGSELPATLRRSCQEAQDTFTTAHDSEPFSSSDFAGLEDVNRFGDLGHDLVLLGCARR